MGPPEVPAVYQAFRAGQLVKPLLRMEKAAPLARYCVGMSEENVEIVWLATAGRDGVFVGRRAGGPLPDRRTVR